MIPSAFSPFSSTPILGSFDGICWAFVVKTEKANLGSENQNSFKSPPPGAKPFLSQGAVVLTVEMQEHIVVTVGKRVKHHRQSS